MKNLLKAIKDSKRQRVGVVGDIILDHYPKGYVERISPDAGVPVLKVESDDYRLGGAANVAANIADLGGKVSLLGFIGKDSEGERLCRIAAEKDIDFIPNYSIRTTLKMRPTSGSHQQYVRIDWEDSSPKHFDLSELSRSLEGTELVVVSDYAKGVVTQELTDFLRNTGKRILIGPKQKNLLLYHGAYLIVPNKREAFDLTDCTDVHDAGKRLMKLLSTNVIITRGSEGMSIFQTDSGQIRDVPTYAKGVYDITGAGDTVLATLAFAISSGMDLEQAAILANHAAGIVVAKPGTSTLSFSELERKVFQESGKIKTLSELKTIVNNYRREGMKVVWTNGCFDLIHPGHTELLRKARELGDYLIVGINSDESVRVLKGEGRPIHSESERAQIISSFEFVDSVLIFPELSAGRYLLALKPDIFVKGADYSLADMNTEERAALESYRGKAVFIPLLEGKSTSRLIEDIKRHNNLA